MLLIVLSCAWVAGIWLGSQFRLPYLLILTGLIPLLPLLFVRHRRKAFLLAGVSLFLIFGGAIHYQASIPVIDESQLQFYNGQTVEIKGLVGRDPEVRDKLIHLELSASEIKLDGKWQELEGRALLYTPRYTEYHYGDVLRVTGKLETPPRLGDFDYRGYLANQGIFSVMRYPGIAVLEPGKGVKPLAWVYSLRNRLAQTLVSVLPEPQAALAQGILLGLRGNIPPELKNDFSRSGTAHILAISGQNLSIIAGILVSIGIWLFGRRHYLYVWLALAILWIYTLLTGLSPPVIRSAIMASLFLMAELLGRQRSAATSLAFAAAVMIGISPPVLWDASFQLSFLAMGGLVLIAPPLQGVSRKAVSSAFGESGLPARFANMVGDSFSVTLAAIIAVWPVIAYYFDIISLIGPVATLFAAPALPAIIVTGVIVGIIGLIALPAGVVLGWVAWLFLAYFLVVVQGFAAIPLSFVQTSTIDITFLWIYYPVLGLVIWAITHRSQTSNIFTRGLASAEQLVSRMRMKWVIPPLLIIAVLVSLAAATLPDGNLHVSFLDVGQGEATLIQQGKQQVLVDGGPSPQAINLELGKRMPFWDRTVELVILTHPDTDHLAGLVEVLQRYRVEQVLYPDFASDSPLYQRWLQIIDEKRIKRTVAQAGQRITLDGGTKIEILSPPRPAQFEAGSDDNGIVLRLSRDSASFLLTADVTWQGEFALISQRADLVSSVLKVAHHGSESSTTAEFLAVVSPQVAVISVGKDNKYGHPRREVLDRLEQKISGENIYRTDKQGTLEFITDGERLWVNATR